MSKSQPAHIARSEVARSGNQMEVVEAQTNATEAVEEVEILQASIKVGTVAQIVVAVIATIGLIYLLKMVLVTILASMLLAYILDPPVSWLTHLRVTRWMGALIAVLGMVVVEAGLAYFSYNRAVDFANELPHYSSALSESVSQIRARVDEIVEKARSAIEPPKDRRQPVPVRIQGPQGVSRIISENGGAIFEVRMAIGFVPFLVYFMLASKETRKSPIEATVRLFPKEHRLLALRTVAPISVMIRSHIIANVLVGILNSLALTILFGILGIKYFYFIGAISGFVSLIPYLGVFLSLYRRSPAESRFSTRRDC